MLLQLLKADFHECRQCPEPRQPISKVLRIEAIPPLDPFTAAAPARWQQVKLLEEHSNRRCSLGIPFQSGQQARDTGPPIDFPAPRAWRRRPADLECRAT